MTNIGNEFGEVLNSVLTTGEGAGLEELCQGIVTRYKNAGQAEPEVIYVDRDCCNQSGVSSVTKLFHPWRSAVRLDSFHFMRRFNCGLTTEHHPLYGTFCTKLSACIFEWDQDDVHRLKEAKIEEWKSTHSGYAPSEEQLMATISSAELKRHCRRRTRGVEEMRRMISGLLESVWELTDTTGLRLVSHDAMQHIWKVQQKHLECLQDPPGVALYTKVGTLQKGGKQLDILRCGRGSSSLESFHRHQCTFVPGWRCNALHMQMYMIEGLARWNMSRAKEGVEVDGASNIRSFDVRLMSHLNNLSQRICGSALVAEFTPPRRPTDERIAVDYLLAQTNRGDLLSPSRVPEISALVFEEDEEEADCDTHVEELEAEAEEADSTILSTDQLSRGDTESEVLATETSQCDSRGVVGWEAVDVLAAYFVGLNRTITALSTKEEIDIVRLYTNLHDMDKAPSRYTQKARKKARVSAGPWRSPRKPSGSAPGQQAAERLYMTHGQAAQDPEVNRVSECVCLRLAKEFEQARNRPKDTKGKILPIPQSIVSIYSHIRQLLEDSKVVQNKTNLVLVPVNNTTVSSWLLRRDKRKDRDMLLQGTALPKQLHLAKEPLPAVNRLPAAPVQHAHEVMTFEEPENREGEAFPRQRTLGTQMEPERSQSVLCPPQYRPPPFQYPPFHHSSQFLHPQFAHAPQFAQFTHAPPVQNPLLNNAPPGEQAVSGPGSSQACPPFQPRQRKWRLNKAALEDEQRMSTGEPPKKRLSKQNYHYTCKQCGQDKSKRTGHSQVKGRWYCPASGMTIDDWKKNLQ
ncbi:uncharacterized protein LOC130920813 [Corythoichthys intestinalis]|uniref:uncharacterized protein LOC130920813 n=1 Tax=Corythoichthys intestinalis TaxID=161448 RepID=UPI0025A6792A|nr:uncharacterized protein LOC130920813 [Corythoichthys intestinalis]